MLHWVSACTGSWGLGILGAKNCFSAAHCGMLLMLAKARWATMNKPFPQYQGKASQTWQIQTFKICFYSSWKWLIMPTLRWTQPISVQCYVDKSSTEHIFVPSCRGGLQPSSTERWYIPKDGTKHSLACPEPWAEVDPAATFWPASLPVHSVSLPPLPSHSHPTVTAL